MHNLAPVLLGERRGARTPTLMDQHSNSNVEVINYCQHAGLEDRLGWARPVVCLLVSNTLRIL